MDKGHCTYVLGNLSSDNYAEPEVVAKDIARHDEVESIDIVTGDYEILMKLRTKDIDEYYQFVKFLIKNMDLSRPIQ
ncbi:MAG: Lrp/AsnC ligand binding domain-containing protein [Candidatus Woesearchaeota archaeon]